MSLGLCVFLVYSALCVCGVPGLSDVPCVSVVLDVSGALYVL